MVVGTVALQNEAVFFELGGESLGVFDDFGGVSLEIRLQIFTKSDSFSGDNVLERPALRAREDSTIDQGWNMFESMLRLFERIADGAFREDETAARTTKGFMRGASHDLKTVVERVRMDAAGNKTSDMSHVGHEENFLTGFGAEILGDFGDAVEIRDFHESGIANEDDFRMMLAGEFF